MTEGLERLRITRAAVRKGLFLLPAMLMAAQGYCDLWIAAGRQPYVAGSLLVVTAVLMLALLTAVSAGCYLLSGSPWMPSVKLLVLVSGLQLYLGRSLGMRFGVLEILVPVTVWVLWGLMAYRERCWASEER